MPWLAQELGRRAGAQPPTFERVFPPNCQNLSELLATHLDDGQLNDAVRDDEKKKAD